MIFVSCSLVLTEEPNCDIPETESFSTNSKIIFLESKWGGHLLETPIWVLAGDKFNSKPESCESMGSGMYFLEQTY